MSHTIDEEVEQHAMMETSIRSAYHNGSRNYKKRVINMLADKLKHLWNSSEETTRHTILIINEILSEINNIKS